MSLGLEILNITFLTAIAVGGFELGTAKILKIEFLPSMFGNSIFQDIDSVINKLLTKHLDTMIHRVAPIFERNTAELLKCHTEGPVNLLPHLQRTVAEAAMSIEILSPLDRDIVIDPAEGVAELTGTFRSRSILARYFPSLWQIVTWLKVVIYTVMIRFGIALGPLIWTQISAILQQSNEKPSKNDVSLLRILVETSGATNGRIGLKSRLWIFGLVVVFIFASVHQAVSITMWTMFQLALHHEYQDIIRREIHDVTRRDSSPVPVSEFDMRTLRKASCTGSFIREVLRMHAPRDQECTRQAVARGELKECFYVRNTPSQLCKIYDGVGKPFGRQEFDQVIGQSQALCGDFPVACFGPELIKAYPEAKLILTYRDVDEWHHALSGQQLALGDSSQSRKNARDADFLDSTDMAQDMAGLLLKGILRPTDVEHSGWRPLCDFLGKPVPLTPFPRGNDPQSYRRRFAILMLYGNHGLSYVLACTAGIVFLVWVVFLAVAR
ncbi:hypothetical protein BDV30DRAFT_236727 [Aspergillus minisclerotigenes]|uniref:Uncharacterized protein n=1 Tax=Aspergillus minisclerotigenes TaxID=656917 RepID=A0A5N6JAQ2_9EURO|nr:hypothetical protein BDV30DRAFT_236727 [Aspergillus minisclerotigenes]